MKRFRVKAIGLGLALAAGGGAAAGDWGAPGGAPAPLTAPGGAGPLWFPARQPAPAPAPIVTPASGTAVPAPAAAPAMVAPATPVQAPAAPPPTAPVGPRAAGHTADAFGDLPVIPVPLPPGFGAPPAQPQAVAAQPDLPKPLPADKPPAAPRPLDAPRPVEQPPAPPAIPPAAPPMPPATPPMMAPPRPADQPAPLPQPRPADAAPAVPAPADACPVPQPELPAAPPEVMYSPGVLELGKHGTFGSPPIRLSRDYPPMRDLIRKGHRHDDITIMPEEGPAEVAGGDPGSAVAPLDRYFVSGEYLLWWMPGFPVPVLGTTNATPGLNGFLGEPGTTSLIGPGGFIGSARSGFRVRAGAWLDDCGTCGIDGSFFFLGGRSATASATAPGAETLITRPVFVPNPTGSGEAVGESGEYVALPGALAGTLTARGDSFLWGADVNLRKALCTACDRRAEVFVGYRYLNLRESLTITENINVIGTSPLLGMPDPVGTHVVVQDRFRTLNSFNGGQVGALYGRQWGRFDVTGRASVALGTTHQGLDIEGFQVRQRPGMAPMVFNGGLLAVGPNLGHFTRDHFSVVPEVTLNLGYRLAPGVRVFAGYNFLLWTNVIRPGDQIDRVVDVTFVPNGPPAPPSGLARPHPLFTQRDLVVQGVQFGLDLRW